MGELLRRRAIMGAAGGEPSEWDVEWAYTDGMPTVKGWTLATSGAGSVYMQDDGLKIEAKNSASRNYTFDHPTSIGVIEAKFVIPNPSSTSAAMRASCKIGDSTSSVWVYFYYSSGRKIMLNTSNFFAGGQVIGQFEYDTEYTLTIKINDGKGEVILNGVTLVSDFDATKTIWKAKFSFGLQNGANTGALWGALWKSVKIKYDRL